MPYKDVDKNRQHNRDYYARNKERLKEREESLRKEDPRTLRKCNKCNELISTKDFLITKGYRSLHCRFCAVKRTLANRALPENYERYRAYERAHRKDSRKALATRLRKWGITVEVYEGMLVRQGGRCVICKLLLDGKKKCIDHDHSCKCGYVCSTKKGECCGKCIRGILCNDCNIMLGMSHEKIDVLKAAIKYLNEAVQGTPSASGIEGSNETPTVE